MDQTKEIGVWHMLDTLNSLESQRYVREVSGKATNKILNQEIDKQRGEIFAILKKELLDWIPTRTWSETEQGFSLAFVNLEDAPFQVDFISKMAERGRKENNSPEIIPGITVALHPWSALIHVNKNLIKTKRYLGKTKKHFDVELQAKDGSSLKLTVFGVRAR